MKKGCGSASLWGNGYRGRRPETGISRNLELRHLGKCVLFSWLAPPKAGGELALAPERGIVGRKEAPLRRFATPPPPCGARKTHRAYADPRVFRPLRNPTARWRFSPVAGRGKCVRPQFSVRGEGFGLPYPPVTVEPLQSRRQAAVTAPPAGEPGAAPAASPAPARESDPPRRDLFSIPYSLFLIHSSFSGSAS